MPDLFDYNAPRYPASPGHMGGDTSLAGAERIAPVAADLRSVVLRTIQSAGAHGATGDEVAAVLDWERFRVRPRTSELKAMGKILDSGLRRLSDSGVLSIVWIAPEFCQAVTRERQET